MNDLKLDFLRQSVSELENLRRKLEAENLSEDLLREAFRQTHTIKGTAQIFAFDEISRLSHELENLLQAARENKFVKDEKLVSLLQEGITLLTGSLHAASEEKQSDFPTDFVDKIKRITKTQSSSKEIPFELPPDIQSQMSQREKDSLTARIEGGKINLFLIEVGFDFANFETNFKKFRGVLDSAGEVAAAFPSRKFTDRLGFQFITTTEAGIDEILRAITPFDAEITYKIEHGKTIPASGRFEEMLRETIEGAQRLADHLGKKIVIEASQKTITQNGDGYLKIIFDALLHLTRNAVDHAIAEKGKINILLNEDETGLYLIFSDDGKGIDIDKVKTKALEKNLISAENTLTSREILDLIFLPGFTTAAEITEVSGRGVGLDAVKSAVENANGTISVKSERDFGTTFEIVLPYEK